MYITLEMETIAKQYFLKAFPVKIKYLFIPTENLILSDYSFNLNVAVICSRSVILVTTTQMFNKLA